MRDADGVPVYFERWQRRDGDTNGEKYFAMRRLSADGKGRDALLIIIGRHFALAVDRPSYPDFAGCTGPAGPALIDQALPGLRTNADGSIALSNAGARKDALAYLDLEGSYGQIGDNKAFIIMKSTHPWREGTHLFANSVTRLLLLESAGGAAQTVLWNDETWMVVENSFPLDYLHQLFSAPIIASRL